MLAARALLYFGGHNVPGFVRLKSKPWADPGEQEKSPPTAKGISSDFHQSPIIIWGPVPVADTQGDPPVRFVEEPQITGVVCCAPCFYSHYYTSFSPKKSAASAGHGNRGRGGSPALAARLFYSTRTDCRCQDQKVQVCLRQPAGPPLRSCAPAARR